jgi:hypothetical protein
MKASFEHTILPNTSSTKCVIEVDIKRNRSIYHGICRSVFLLLSGTVTLKAIFHHFQHYIFKRYQSINEHIEKPTILLFQQYPVAPLVLHLTQWRLANEAESLIHLHYAQIKRNPE